MSAVGTVAELWRFPVKSFQGERVDEVELDDHGVQGDRDWALVDVASGRLLSAKRHARLFSAAAATRDGEVVITLPEGPAFAATSPRASARLSAWLGWPVELRHVDDHVKLAYEMTFDPPNDDAEYVTVPAPRGSFLDLAGVHLVSRASLAHAGATFPTLDWDVRRFRPNVVVDVEGAGPDGAAFVEDGWVGTEVGLGGARVRIDQPTVRCAMPLRAQPGLARQPRLYDALEAVHRNHLGVYATVAGGGVVSLGSAVTVGS